ncbi:MAG TPA: AraC family transcriptional regulator [Puia sp.]
MLTTGSRVLLLDGSPAIHRCVYRCGQESSLFLERTRLLFVRRGSCKLCFGKEEWELGCNQIASLRSSLLLEFRTGASGPDFTGNQYLFFDVSSEILQEFVGLCSWVSFPDSPASAVETAVADEKLLAYMESLDSYFTDSWKWNGPLIRLKLLELLFFLADSAPLLLAQLLDIKRNFRPDIRATVEENIENGLSLRELASLAGRSLSSFTRDFQVIYNMPPSKWMRQKRLEKARKLLTSTSMSVTEICYTLGFENLTNFCRVFKAHYGRRPMEERNYRLPTS